MTDPSPGGAAASGPLVGPGATLLSERRRQGLSVGDVSRQLKLSVRQVEALERDDFSQYKGSVFIHGFLRNYAKLLGIDPEPLVRAADSVIAPPAPEAPARTIEPAVPADEPKGRSGATTIVVAILAVIAIGLFYAGMKRSGPQSAPADTVALVREAAPPKAAVTEKKPEASPKAAPQSVPKPEPAAKAPAKTPLPASTQDATVTAGSGNLMVVRMVFEQESWVEVKDRNGKPVFGQLNPAGSRRIARGEPPLSIVIGNAAGVRLFKGEESIDLAPHTRVDVARLTLE